MNILLKFTFLLLILSYHTYAIAGEGKSPYVSKVLEFVPAPGQFVNENFPAYAAGDTETQILEKASGILVGKTGSFVSLGAWGGYVIVGFDHPIANVPGEADFKVYGNALPTWAEPGIVMVAQDQDGDGKPDQWYELAGSEYYKPGTIHNYQITYYKPEPLNANVPWKDNLGHSDVVVRNNYHQQASYYPLWLDKDSLILTGSLLNAVFPIPNLNKNSPFSWGYADNQPNSNSTFNIEWAVDKYGNPVHLTHIDFIKVYTATQIKSSMSGETSTEFAGVEDLHPDAAIAAEQRLILDLSGADVSNNGISSFTFNTGTPHFDINDIFRFSHNAVDYGGGFYAFDGFTCTSVSPDMNEPDDLYAGEIINKSAVGGWEYNGINEFAPITGGGVDGPGSPCLLNFGSSEVSFTDGKEREVYGAYVTNAAITYISMKYGDSFAKRFGGETGNDADSLMLVATGMNGETETGKTSFFLANYQSAYPCDDYIVSDWSWMDLSSLGKVTKIKFEFLSSDQGGWGSNTPSYFCMDKLTVEKISSSTGKQAERVSNIRVYPNPASSFIKVQAVTGERIALFDLYGRKVKEVIASSETSSIDIEDLSAGIYLVKVAGEAFRIVKK